MIQPIIKSISIDIDPVFAWYEIDTKIGGTAH